jgi:hypothetical protein
VSHPASLIKLTLSQCCSNESYDKVNFACTSLRDAEVEETAPVVKGPFYITQIFVGSAYCVLILCTFVPVSKYYVFINGKQLS